MTRPLIVHPTVDSETGTVRSIAVAVAAAE